MPELDQIIERGLQKDPRDRYRATQDIVVDLERLRTDLREDADDPRPPRPPRPRSRQWLVNHHVVMSVVYIGLLYPAWFARGWLPSPWNSAFLLGILAAAAAGASLRLHLWFTATTFPDQFAEQQESNARWTRLCDLAFAGIQLAVAFAISGMHPEFAMLFVGAAVLILIGSLVIEPATARAALSPRR